MRYFYKTETFACDYPSYDKEYANASNLARHKKNKHGNRRWKCKEPGWSKTSIPNCL
jgi:hypothetical protein